MADTHSTPHRKRTHAHAYGAPTLTLTRTPLATHRSVALTEVCKLALAASLHSQSVQAAKKPFFENVSVRAADTRQPFCRSFARRVLSLTLTLAPSALYR